jgi:predicted nucleotidyltransferase
MNTVQKYNLQKSKIKHWEWLISKTLSNKKMVKERKRLLKAQWQKSPQKQFSLKILVFVLQNF